MISLLAAMTLVVEVRRRDENNHYRATPVSVEEAFNFHSDKPEGTLRVDSIQKVRLVLSQPHHSHDAAIPTILQSHIRRCGALT